MTLLKHHIRSLRLREDAPFPSQVDDAQQAIREWRHEQLVRRLDGDTIPREFDLDDFVEEQE